jgi:hypothetical protein
VVSSRLSPRRGPARPGRQADGVAADATASLVQLSVFVVVGTGWSNCTAHLPSHCHLPVGRRAQVGHNMLLDLAHLEAAFGLGSLPPDFDAFASQAPSRHTK